MHHDVRAMRDCDSCFFFDDGPIPIQTCDICNTHKYFRSFFGLKFKLANIVDTMADGMELMRRIEALESDNKELRLLMGVIMQFRAGDFQTYERFKKAAKFIQNLMMVQLLPDEAHSGFRVLGHNGGKEKNIVPVPTPCRTGAAMTKVMIEHEPETEPCGVKRKRSPSP